ncbi:MAG: zinc-ribbon domain containing protein [Roseiflexaceae bacterium]
MSYADKTLTCRDCGTPFVFTAGEQEFYAQKGFANEPTRCANCRRARKAASGNTQQTRQGHQSYQGGGYGSRSGYDTQESYGGRASGAHAVGERVMFTTTCANCGSECQVPFVPRGSKPVLCDTCFRAERGR